MFLDDKKIYFPLNELWEYVHVQIAENLATPVD